MANANLDEAALLHAKRAVSISLFYMSPKLADSIEKFIIHFK